METRCLWFRLLRLAYLIENSNPFGSMAVNCSLPSRTLSVACLTLILAALAGCERNEAKSKATQVAAQVNSDEITVHQINAILTRTPAVTPESAPQAKRQILDRLVDQQLALQQALRRKLDRSPEVLQALETARAEILARAFADTIARTQPKPTPAETSKYYAEHPELFAQRRVFVLEEINLAGADDAIAGLKEQVARSRSMQDIAAWLRTKDIKFAESRGVRTAEQIPLETLPRLQAMKEGEMQLFEGGAGKIQVVIRVVAAKPAPVDQATAAPRIQQFLFNRRVSEALVKEMKQVRDAAKIKYVGEFAAGSEAVSKTTAQ